MSQFIKYLKIAFSVVVWAAIFAYLVWAGKTCTRAVRDRRVREVVVVVRDSARARIITPDMVRLWMQTAGIDLRNASVTEVNTAGIRDLVLGHLFVDDARVYTDLDGRVTISLTQRRPVARVDLDNGYEFYITADGYILPLQSHEVIYVPVVTGSFSLPFERGFVGRLTDPGKSEKNLRDYYLFTLKLINFVNVIEASDFWRSEVVQIVVDGSPQQAGKEPKVEIVPRSGNLIVALGTLDDVAAKLDRLSAFYTGGLRYEGWDSYRRISVEYNGQVVATK